jgi:uncharacterized membrane protein
MHPHLTLVLTIVAALGSALIAGVFLAFSSFVMKALVTRPPADGVAAMQAINEKVLNPWFLGVFLGTAGVCAVLAVLTVVAWAGPRSVLQLAGTVLYFAGCFVVTVAFNVPRNEALARVPPDSRGAAEHWAAYVRGWTWWNYVRTFAGIAASAAHIVAVCEP